MIRTFLCPQNTVFYKTTLKGYTYTYETKNKKYNNNNKKNHSLNTQKNLFPGIPFLVIRTEDKMNLLQDIFRIQPSFL